MSCETTPKTAEEKPVNHFIERYHLIRARLHELYPTVFTARGTVPIALKLGIRDDLFADPVHEFTKTQIRLFLRAWTRRWEYQRVLVSGGNRHALDGSVAGVITPEDQAYAVSALKKKRPRRPPTAQPAIEPAPDQEPTKRITRERFVNSVGREPEADDLDRCNCPSVGEIGHALCGWNHEKNLPVFMAGPEQGGASV